MSTGLFSTPTSQGIGARAHQRRRQRSERKDTLNQFAERLAEHGDVARAAAEIGKSASYGRVLFGKIKTKLGWQAS